MQAQLYPISILESPCIPCYIERSYFLFMPSATYFLSPATKSRQKMPLSNAEGLAQRKSFVRDAQTMVAFRIGWIINVRCESDARAVRNGFGQ